MFAPLHVVDMCGIDGNNRCFINICNCYCMGQVCPCQINPSKIPLPI
jgi:hypothetical protein